MSAFQRDVLPRLTADAVYGPHVRWGSKRGRVWRAACPIHGGDNPSSLVIDVQSLVFYCHRCGATGDPIDFLAQLEYGAGVRARGQIFRAAADELRRRAGASAAMPVNTQKEKPRLEWSTMRRAIKGALRTEDFATELAAWGVIDHAAVRKECVLMRKHHVPRWAPRCGSYRLVIWLWTPECCTPAGAVLRSFDPPKGKPKSCGPMGYTARGLCMVNAAARTAMRIKSPHRTFIVREGERDFLLDASRGHAVIGIRSGSWSTEWAAALPPAAHLEIATDHDEAGEKYARHIVRTLTHAERKDVTWERTEREDAW